MHEPRIVMTGSAVMPSRRLGIWGGRSPTALAGVLAALLSVGVVVIVLGQRAGGIASAVAAVALTAPVACARIAPTPAALTLAGATIVNELFFGHLIRCGAAMPAAFFVAFFAGYVLGRRGLTAFAAVSVSIALQCLFDPRLGADATALMIPLATVFFGAGFYVRKRAAMVTSLRNTTAELLEQRERTARLAVAADREKLEGQLNRTLQSRMGMIASVAQERHGGKEQFGAIERLGRQTLEEVRGLLGSLADSPTQPEPGLADLADVCARATTADVRLTINGRLRPLPTSIELSVCRIVEQLLRLLPDEPASRVEVRLDVAAEGLDIVIAGTPTIEIGLEHVRALTQARAALHGGRVAIADESGRRLARVWLPLVTAHD